VVPRLLQIMRGYDFLAFMSTVIIKSLEDIAPFR
jgi:hypothetical protein